MIEQNRDSVPPKKTARMCIFLLRSNNLQLTRLENMISSYNQSFECIDQNALINDATFSRTSYEIIDQLIKLFYSNKQMQQWLFVCGYSSVK